VKARLARIAASLQFIDESPPARRGADVLERLERGEISAAEAISALEEGR
jgi:hypothetical protein